MSKEKSSQLIAAEDELHRATQAYKETFGPRTLGTGHAHDRYEARQSPMLTDLQYVVDPRQKQRE